MTFGFATGVIIWPVAIVFLVSARAREWATKKLHND
jgi:hypothetical protein